MSEFFYNFAQKYRKHHKYETPNMGIKALQNSLHLVL